MRHLHGLSRQIALSISAVVLSVTLVILVSSYVFYALLMQLNPSFSASAGWLPSEPEWIWMASITLVSLVMGAIMASRLAKRILAPLNSVVDSVRRVAQGDLDARANAGDRSLGETALLVDDFNTMAERLQRMAHEMTTWNAAVAHELRTPVTILRGRLQGLAEGVFIPDQKQFRSLLTQVEGLSRLIEDLRMLSLADSGHLQLQLEDADISSEIRDVAQLLESEFSKAGFSLVLNLTPEPLRCDTMRIRQIVMALLDNARRYAQPGPVRIDTWISGNTFQLRVEDYGTGIPPEIAARIFDAFSRGDDSRSRQSGGSGLGLAVVHAIARAHGGKAIYACGASGGAAFEIVLPR